MFKIVGDVRGKGLMIGIEMVTDKESRNPLPVEKVGQIWEDCKDMKLLLGKGGLFGNVFRIKPPMCITKQVQYQDTLNALHKTDSMNVIFRTLILRWKCSELP